MADTSVPYFENPAFKKSFADVPVDASNNISTKEFVEACESLVLIFGKLPKPSLRQTHNWTSI